MINATKIRERSLVLMVAVLLALITPMTYAVVKNVTVVDSGGNPLGNTKVTIVFPDGTEDEEETDDKGMLIYDFPGDGDYMIKYPGGSMGVSVSAGIPTWAWVAGGLAAAGGVAVALDDDDDDSSSSPGSGSDPGSGSGNCVQGTYNVSFQTESNPDMHPENSFDGTYEIFCDTGSVVNQSGSGAGGFSCGSNVTSTCNDPGSICSIGGFNTQCSLTSSFGSGGTWSGTMSGGIDGALPDTNMDGMNQPLVVTFTGTP